MLAEDMIREVDWFFGGNMDGELSYGEFQEYVNKFVGHEITEAKADKIYLALSYTMEDPNNSGEALKAAGLAESIEDYGWQKWKNDFRLG